MKACATEERPRLSGVKTLVEKLAYAKHQWPAQLLLSFRASRHALQGAAYSGNNQRQILSRLTQWCDVYMFMSKQEEEL